MTEAEIREEMEEMCNLTLFTKEQKPENEILMTESFGCAILDTACTKTVCGKEWFHEYIDKLAKERKKAIQTKSSRKAFRFGNGTKVNSYMTAYIPAQIGDVKCRIETEVVDIDLPLLLSKASLKKANAVLDMTNDKVTMFNQPVKLNYTSTGHYCIDITENKQVRNEECESLKVEENMDEEKKKTYIMKLHKQFGHASAENLKRLMKNAGLDKTDMFQNMTEILEDCEVCARYRKTPAKPVVGLPMAEDYNQTVAIDLHELKKNVWYFHMIDEFTRFSAAAIITSKQSSVIVNNFMKHWIAVHGPSKAVLSDNGAKFNNEEFRDV